ncbi:MAG: hypothetical protein KAT90_15375, partial [Gammaproteobacteria bacterium]|nr:hypothetical protein [Gammaproteobacteria bacterium]
MPLLKNIPTLTSRPDFLAFVTFFSICLLWQTLVSFYHISESVFPGPMVVLVTFWHHLLDGSLLQHTVASL